MNCANHSDQAAVAFCRTCGKPLCQVCTRDVRGVIYCESCLAARLEGTAAPAPGFVPAQPQAPYQPVFPPGSSVPHPIAPAGPNPTVAGILGAVPFGLGAVYCGQYAKGLAHLGIMVFAIVLQAQDVQWYVHMTVGILMAFFWVYQIVDSVRTARAIQTGEPVPDPMGLSQMFGTGEKFEGTKVPAGAAVLIGLGVLFLLDTAGFLEFGMEMFIALILLALGGWLFAKQWGLVSSSNPAICRCEQCRMRKVTGPAVLVTLGILFLLDSTSHIGFHRTWPAILLVIGVVKLMQGNASSAGHIGYMPGIPGVPPTTPVPPVTPPAPQSTDPASSGEVKNV